MAMTSGEREVIRNVTKKLKAGTTSLDPKLVPHLEALRIWLDTWVIPPLELISDENRKRSDIELAKGLSR